MNFSDLQPIVTKSGTCDYVGNITLLDKIQSVLPPPGSVPANT